MERSQGFPATGAVTTSQAAEMLQVSEERVRQLADAGRLRVLGVVGNGTRLLDRASVERLAAARALNPPRAGRPRGGA